MDFCVSTATMLKRTHHNFISALPILLDDYFFPSEESYSYSYSHLQRCQCLIYSVEWQNIRQDELRRTWEVRAIKVYSYLKTPRKTTNTLIPYSLSHSTSPHRSWCWRQSRSPIIWVFSCLMELLPWEKLSERLDRENFRFYITNFI